MLSNHEINNLAIEFDIDPAMVHAIIKVESKGKPFTNGLPTILFERHIFYKYLQKRKYYTLVREFSRLRPDLCHSKATGKGKYGTYGEQHKRLDDAIKLLEIVKPEYKTMSDEQKKEDKVYQDVRECALMACSWGLGQVMGFNYKEAGYTSIQAFINDMYDSEEGQVRAILNYLTNRKGIRTHINNKDWHGIAYLYNGSNYARNNYHNKLRDAYDTYTT